MIDFLLMCFAAGFVIAIPVWILSQRFGTRRGLHEARRFKPDDALPYVIEPVVLKGRLVVDLDTAEDDDGHGALGGAR